MMTGYGLIGLGLMWLCRGELLRYWSVMGKVMMAGFPCLLLGLLSDTASHDDHFFLWMTGDLLLAKNLNGWFAALEDALTLLPEALFIAAFYAAWHSARNAGASNSVGADL